jgi:hypothetical protein
MLQEREPLPARVLAWTRRHVVVNLVWMLLLAVHNLEWVPQMPVVQELCLERN